MEVPPACSWSRAGTRLTPGWGWLHPEHESLVRELEYPCALCCSHPQSFVTWSWVKGPNPSLCIGCCCWALPGGPALTWADGWGWGDGAGGDRTEHFMRLSVQRKQGGAGGGLEHLARPQLPAAPQQCSARPRRGEAMVEGPRG